MDIIFSQAGKFFIVNSAGKTISGPFNSKRMAQQWLHDNGWP